MQTTPRPSSLPVPSIDDIAERTFPPLSIWTEEELAAADSVSEASAQAVCDLLRGVRSSKTTAPTRRKNGAKKW